MAAFHNPTYQAQWQPQRKISEPPPYTLTKTDSPYKACDLNPCVVSRDSRLCVSTHSIVFHPATIGDADTSKGTAGRFVIRITPPKPELRNDIYFRFFISALFTGAKKIVYNHLYICRLAYFLVENPYEVFNTQPFLFDKKTLSQKKYFYLVGY